MKCNYCGKEIKNGSNFFFLDGKIDKNGLFCSENCSEDYSKEQAKNKYEDTERNLKMERPVMGSFVLITTEQSKAFRFSFTTKNLFDDLHDILHSYEKKAHTFYEEEKEYRRQAYHGDVVKYLREFEDAYLFEMFGKEYGPAITNYESHLEYFEEKRKGIF